MTSAVSPLALPSISCWRTHNLRLQPCDQRPRAQLLCPQRSVTTVCSRPLVLPRRSGPVSARQRRCSSHSPSSGRRRIAPRARHPILPLQELPLGRRREGGLQVLISVDLPERSRNASDYDPVEPPRSRDPYLRQHQQSPSPKQIHILNPSLQDGISLEPEHQVHQRCWQRRPRLEAADRGGS